MGPCLVGELLRLFSWNDGVLVRRETRRSIIVGTVRRRSENNLASIHIYFTWALRVALAPSQRAKNATE